MLPVLCAFGEKNVGIFGDVSYDIPDGKRISDDTVLNITIASHSSRPYNENWKVWEYIKDATGETLNHNTITASDFERKFPLIMASSESFSDAIGFRG